MPKVLGVNHQHAMRALEKVRFVVVRHGKHSVMCKDQRFMTMVRHTPFKELT